MVATVRNKQNPFFATANHVKLAKRAENKGLIDVTGDLAVVNTATVIEQTTDTSITILSLRPAWNLTYGTNASNQLVISESA